MKTKFNSSIRAACQLFCGAIMLMASSAQAQNLFVGTGGNSIIEFTPGGVQSTFASGLAPPYGLAIDSEGDLFAASPNGSSITEITPGGVQSTFASGLDDPYSLAFDPGPEPSTLGLLAVGVAALLVRRRATQ